MTTLAARTVLREWNVLQPFCTYLPRCTLSTAVERNEEVANADVRSLIDPLTHPDFFQVHDLFTVTDLFEARVHLGHKIGSLHNNMRPFIFGNRLSHLVIDLDQTAELLRDALNFTAHIAFRDGIILFVTRSPQNSYIVDKTAKECEEFSHTRYWKSGTLTNATRQFGTITRLPDLCIFFSTLDSVLHQHPAVQQMAKMCIPTAGIVDTNCDPNLITYPVPGNDDTPCAIQLYCRLFKEAIMRGKTARKLISKRMPEI